MQNITCPLGFYFKKLKTHGRDYWIIPEKAGGDFKVGRQGSRRASPEELGNVPTHPHPKGA